MTAHSDGGRPIVCIGASWGGVAAIRSILSALPQDLAAPVCVVQHRPEEHGHAEIVRGLGRTVRLPICEPEDKEPLEAGSVYIAPAGYHMLVEDWHVSLSTEDRVRWSRPSIDVLFESVAEEVGSAATAVILTGANDDGCRGSRAVYRAGGCVIAQDPEGAERPEMPSAPIRAGWVHQVLPLEQIAAAVARRVREDVVT